jgi:hypothetical protein
MSAALWRYVRFVAPAAVENSLEFVADPAVVETDGVGEAI